VSFDSAKELEDACANVNGSFWHGRRITCIPRNEEGGNRANTERKHHQGAAKEPTSQLFVGNIPYETTDAELNKLFRKFDNVKDVRVAVDRTTGWPRGFAHVDFADVESAAEAKRKLEGATLGDRALRLDFADGFQKRRDDGARPSYRRDENRDSSRHSGRRD
jgi:RNA recognition motif-containing protein